MLKEVYKASPISKLPIASSCAYAPALTIIKGKQKQKLKSVLSCVKTVSLYYYGI
jgi:hypothetical protein